MSEKFSAPAIDKTEFNCPHCGVRAPQIWAITLRHDNRSRKVPHRPTIGEIQQYEQQKVDPEKEDKVAVVEAMRLTASGEVHVLRKKVDPYSFEIINLETAQCFQCKKLSVWLHNQMVYPTSGEVHPHDDLPDNVKSTFREAAEILSISARASAALARLALQEFCIELKCETKNLNDQIGELVNRGLSSEIAQMLDGVRVIGNNAVHPGTINIKDNRKIAEFLLNCINRICQRMVTEPKQAEELFQMLPEGARKAIEKRDTKK